MTEQLKENAREHCSEADIVVIGSGAAGLTAAIVAAKAGLSVMLLEKAEYFGGTTALSGGGVWIPNNHYQQRAGFKDSKEQAVQYLQAMMGDLFDAAKIDAYLTHAPEMLEYMETNTEVKFYRIAVVDYEPEFEGSVRGRSLNAANYDGRQLGSSWLGKIRPVLPQLNLFGSMQLSLRDLPYFTTVHKSLKSFMYSGKRFLRFVVDRLCYGRGAELANGNALVGQLVASALDAGVTLRDKTSVERLVIEGGHVTGVETLNNGSSEQVKARRAVILATGGFGANPQLRKQYVPLADNGWSLQPESNQGDGIRLGQSVGGSLVENNVSNVIWAPMSSLLKPNGERVTFPHLTLDRYCPGSIVVNASGERFVNESTHYQNFGNKMAAENVQIAYLISDHTALKKYGMGLAKAAPYPIKRFIKSGYLRKAESIGELADKIGVDASALQATVKRFNQNAEVGKDPDFQRGEDIFSARLGDPNHSPNPCLGPIVNPPFYAVEIYPGNLSTLCGLETNEHAQVLGAQGEPVKGLYAAGVDMNSVFAGTYPGAGASIAPAMTFGYVAARHAAAKP